MDPGVLAKLVNKPEIHSLSEEVKEKLERVLNLI